MVLYDFENVGTRVFPDPPWVLFSVQVVQGTTRYHIGPLGITEKNFAPSGSELPTYCAPVKRLAHLAIRPGNPHQTK